MRFDQKIAGVRTSLLQNTTLKKKTTAVTVSLLRWAFLLAFSYILLYPLLYMIATSIKGPADYIDPTVVWVAKHLSFDSFVLANETLSYASSLWNTLKLELVSAGLEIIVCSFVGYGLARFDFKEKKLLMLLLFLTIMVPAQMTIIPVTLNFKHMDFLGILNGIGQLIGRDIRPSLIDTPWTFYLPSLLGVGLRSGILIFIYMQFFKGLPKELEEAAWIDGAGLLGTYFKVILPSAGVVILTVSIFAIIWHWNDYYLAIMYTSKDFPISVALSDIFQKIELKGINHYDQRATSCVMAGCLMTVTPMLVMYLILQRKFIQSIDKVGIVG